MCNIGFIMSTCSSFIEPNPLKILYCSTAHLNLAYYHSSWTNNTIEQTNLLESVQNNFSSI